MYPEALLYLLCPACRSALGLQPGAVIAADGAVERGQLRCTACSATYTIRHGVVDLLGQLIPDSPAQLANILPPTAWAYERTWRPHALTLLSGEPFGYDRELPLITRLVAPARAGLVVDVACSNGLYARTLARARADIAGHVVGIDHSLAMLHQARAFAQAAGLRITYVRAKAQALPFATGAATAVAMGGSLNEIGDADQALREMRRILVADGRCVMMNLVQATSGPGRALQQLLASGGLDFSPLSEVNRRFAAAGLRRVAQWQYRVVVFTLALPTEPA